MQMLNPASNPCGDYNQQGTMQNPLTQPLTPVAGSGCRLPWGGTGKTHCYNKVTEGGVIYPECVCVSRSGGLPPMLKKVLRDERTPGVSRTRRRKLRAKLRNPSYPSTPIGQVDDGFVQYAKKPENDKDENPYLYGGYPWGPWGGYGYPGYYGAPFGPYSWSWPWYLYGGYYGRGRRRGHGRRHRRGRWRR